MNSDVSGTEVGKAYLNIQQLEGIIRKVVREELMEFAVRDEGTFILKKESPLHKDMQDILERKKSRQLKFHTHEEVWNG